MVGKTSHLLFLFDAFKSLPLTLRINLTLTALIGGFAEVTAGGGVTGGDERASNLSTPNPSTISSHRMMRDALSAWLTVQKHWNDWFRIDERGQIMDVLERFQTETAQRIVLEAIAHISVYEGRNKDKVRDGILSQTDFKKPFEEAVERLKEKKIAENNQKQVEIAQELAAKVDLLNEINSLCFGYHWGYGYDRRGDDRKRMYEQLKQLRRDQQETLLRKFRQEDGNFKIDYIKALFKNYPSQWNIPPDAIVSRMEADLDLFKMLVDEDIAGFGNFRSKNNWFNREEEAIFCMLRHLPDHSHRVLLLQRIKNVDSDQIYQVFTDYQFSAVRQPSGDHVCKRSEANPKPWVRLEEINVDFVFRQLLDALTLRRDISPMDVTEDDAKKLYEFVQMFSQHRAVAFVQTLDQSNCPQVIHKKFYAAYYSRDNELDKKGLVSQLTRKWLTALEKGLNLHSQEQWTAAQNEMMTDAQFERFQRPFQLCATICGAKQMRRIERGNEYWSCTRMTSLTAEQLLDFVLAIWNAEGSGKEVSAALKTLTDLIINETAAAPLPQLTVEFTALMKNKAYTLLQIHFILAHIVTSFTVEVKHAILHAFSQLSDSPGERLIVLQQHQHLLPVVKKALLPIAQVWLSTTSALMASTSTSSSTLTATSDCNVALVEGVSSILYMAQRVATGIDPEGAFFLKLIPNKFAKLSPNVQCKLLALLLGQSGGREGAIQILTLLEQTRLNVEQVISVANEVYLESDWQQKRQRNNNNELSPAGMNVNGLNKIIQMLGELNKPKWFRKVPIAEQNAFICDVVSIMIQDIIRNGAPESSLEKASKFWKRWHVLNILLGRPLGVLSKNDRKHLINGLLLLPSDDELTQIIEYVRNSHGPHQIQALRLLLTLLKDPKLMSPNLANKVEHNRRSLILPAFQLWHSIEKWSPIAGALTGDEHYALMQLLLAIPEDVRSKILFKMENEDHNRHKRSEDVAASFLKQLLGIVDTPWGRIGISGKKIRENWIWLMDLEISGRLQNHHEAASELMSKASRLFGESLSTHLSFFNEFIRISDAKASIDEATSSSREIVNSNSNWTHTYKKLMERIGVSFHSEQQEHLLSSLRKEHSFLQLNDAAKIADLWAKQFTVIYNKMNDAQLEVNVSVLCKNNMNSDDILTLDAS